MPQSNAKTAIVLLLLLSFTTTAKAAERMRKTVNEASVCSVAAPCDDITLELDSVSAVHVVSVTGTPVSGDEFSFGATQSSSASSASAKTGHVSINRRTVASGPGTLDLRFGATPDGACPFDVAAAVSPIKGVGVVIKSNKPPYPTERYIMSGVNISRCDGAGATVSYQDMAINEKGLSGKSSK